MAGTKHSATTILDLTGDGLKNRTVTLKGMVHSLRIWAGELPHPASAGRHGPVRAAGSWIWPMCRRVPWPSPARCAGAPRPRWL